MATDPVVTQGKNQRPHRPVVPDSSMAMTRARSGRQSAALWCGTGEKSDPRLTISEVWASSISRAAESLADFVSTTIGNVKRSR